MSIVKLPASSDVEEVMQLLIDTGIAHFVVAVAEYTGKQRRSYVYSGLPETTLEEVHRWIDNNDTIQRIHKPATKAYKTWCEKWS